MANYQATARSNYFPPNRANLSLLGMLFDFDVVEKNNLATIILQGDSIITIDDDDQMDVLAELGIVGNIDNVDIVELLHLVTQTTIIWMETGHEKARYLVGTATRIDANGQILAHINLNEIYLPNETRCEY